MLRTFAALIVLGIVAGCVATATPRFPADVSAALARHDMRRMETDTLILYYPEHRRELAVRTAERITACQTMARARTRIDAWPAREKAIVVMPEMPFNNAFVMPRALGYEEIAVVPTENTLDFATAFGLPPDPGWVGCHEIVHFTHEQQFAGFWGAMNRVFGHVLSPQVGLDVWFWEGLATYYEDGLGGAAGRLHWPVWRGMFTAAYAGGGVDGDDLSEMKRAAPPGHHYLVGSHFIEWLVREYGEERIWQVIARQGRSVPFMLDVNGRFKRVYGRSLSRLIGEFDAHLAREVPRRSPPAGQTRVREVGRDARYARAPDGTEAVVASGDDIPTHLEIRGPDGRERVRTNLVDLVVPRRQVIAAPVLVSGMSFTADGKRLYLTMLDHGTTYQTTRLLRVDVASGDIDVVASGLGPGGAISPDGTRYYIADPDGDAWGLAAFDLSTGTTTPVIAPQPGRYALRVAPSPRGDRLAVSQWDGQRFSIAIVDARSGAEERVIAGDLGMPVYDASWIDEQRLLYLATVDGRFQAHVHDLELDLRTPISDAPYVAFEPRAAGGTVRFLDREGWRWDLAEIPLPPKPSPPEEPEPEPVDPEPPALAPITPPSAVASPSLAILSDRPYSIFDGFFRPQLHTIALFAPVPGVGLFGIGLSGGDRLGMQRWAISGYINPAPSFDDGMMREPLYSVDGGYANTMLAPWIFTFAGSRYRWHHPIDIDPEEPGPEAYAERSTADLVASFGRVLRATTLISLDGIYTRDLYLDERTSMVRLGGAGLTFHHENLEATPYGGLRRRLALDLRGAYFPTRLSSLDGDLVDTRQELAFTLPLPFTDRHTIDVSGRHRRLDSRDPTGESVPLEVGGAGPFASLYAHREPELEPPLLDDDLLPERLRFSEPLRGFEDWAIPAESAAIVDASWSYPLPIDAGWASTLYFFPGMMLREIDLELFGAAAYVDHARGGGPSGTHAAVGAAVTVAIAIWRVPVLVQYQVAQRLTDDEALAHQVGIALGL